MPRQGQDVALTLEAGDAFLLPEES
jgi:hypothetical protein